MSCCARYDYIACLLRTDACPIDAAKTSPGVCGCGDPDADSDGDGTLNCNGVLVIAVMIEFCIKYTVSIFTMQMDVLTMQ